MRHLEGTNGDFNPCHRRPCRRRAHRLAEPPILALLALLLGPAPAVAQSESGPPAPYADRVWGTLEGDELNISSFAFHDRNRNGVFDMADKPMVGIGFEMTRPDNTILTIPTNGSGFANFRMSIVKRDRDITRPGKYFFEALIPPGWSVTTGDVTQERTFVVLPGAPADLVTRDLAKPVGLASDLTITGSLTGSKGGVSQLKVTEPSGVEEAVPLKSGEEFSFAATPGTWGIALEGLSGQAIRRSVEVGEAPVLLSAFDLARSDPPALPVERVVRFDDLVKTGGVAEIPSGYSGLNWLNWVATHKHAYNGEGYTNGAMSGEYAAYNSSGHPARLSSEEPFDFAGAYFTLAWLSAQGETLRIRGWRDEELVYEDLLSLSALGPVYFDADYRSVTRLEFSTEHFWQFVCDDMRIRLPR